MLRERDCPGEQELAAFVSAGQASLDAPREAIRAHLDECDACLDIVVALARTGAHDSGDYLGAYRVVRRLGAGGMGLVYEAVDEQLQRHVAIKILRSTDIGEEAALLAEGRALARVRDPNVVRVYDVSHAEGAISIVMELVPGKTLRGWLQPSPSVDDDSQTTRRADQLTKAGTPHIPRKGSSEVVPPLVDDVPLIMEVLRQAGLGLLAVHRAGIIHRDFKPDNVLLDMGQRPARRPPSQSDAAGIVTPPPFQAVATTRSGNRSVHGPGARLTPPQRVLVSDFGLARDKSGIAATAGTAVTLAAGGTPAYMAPEQIDQQGHDRRADVYAYAVTAWEALTGQRPFGEERVAELRVAMEGRPRRGTIPAAARGVWPLLERALSVDPERRPPLADIVAAMVPFARKERHRQLFMRGMWLAAAACVIAAVAIAATASRTGQSQGRPAAATAKTVESRTEAGADGCLRLHHSWLRQLAREAALVQRGAPAAAVERLHKLYERDFQSRSRLSAKACSNEVDAAMRQTIETCFHRVERELEIGVERLLEPGFASWQQMTSMFDAVDAKVCQPAFNGDQTYARFDANAHEAMDHIARMYADYFTNNNAAARQHYAAAVVAAAASASSAVKLLVEYEGIRSALRAGDVRAVRTLAEEADKAELSVMAARAWMLAAEHAYTRANNFEEGQQYLERARTIIERSGEPTALVGEWHTAHLAYLFHAGRVDEAKQGLPVVYAATAQDPALTVQVLFLEASMVGNSLDNTETIRILGEVATRVREIYGNDYPPLARVYANRAWSYYEADRFAEASADGRQAIGVARRAGVIATSEYVDLLMIEPAVLSALGQHQATLALLDQLEHEYATVLETSFHTNNMRLMLEAEAHLQLGRPELALESARQAKYLLGRAADRAYELEFATDVLVARATALLGNPRTGLQMLERSLTTRLQHLSPSMRAQAFHSRAELMLLVGAERREAIRSLEDGLTSDDSKTSDVVSAARVLLALLLRESNPGRARALVADAKLHLADTPQWDVVRRRLQHFENGSLATWLEARRKSDAN